MLRRLKIAENNLLEIELNDVAVLLVAFRLQRSLVLTEKCVLYWTETRDLRRKNQDRCRETIEEHIERIYDITRFAGRRRPGPP